MDTYKHPTIKEQRARRARLIAKLGMEPEPENAPREERYAATPGELFKWVAEKYGYDEAVRCQNGH